MENEQLINARIELYEYYPYVYYNDVDNLPLNIRFISGLSIYELRVVARVLIKKNDEVFYAKIVNTENDKSFVVDSIKGKLI